MRPSLIQRSSGLEMANGATPIVSGVCQTAAYEAPATLAHRSASAAVAIRTMPLAASLSKNCAPAWSMRRFRSCIMTGSLSAESAEQEQQSKDGQAKRDADDQALHGL